MGIESADFVVSNTEYTKCPPPRYPEYAFIGRSNVGKSSLINMLTGRKNLARTSSKPGKTQLINHFLINRMWYLVDLPGYGWAKVSKESSAAWKKMINDYLLNRPNLSCLFILLDARLDPQKIDIDFVNWAGTQSIPLVLVLTKCDKQSKGKTSANLTKIKNELEKTWEELPQIFLTSAISKQGREEILRFVEKSNQSFVTID